MWQGSMVVTGGSSSASTCPDEYGNKLKSHVTSLMGCIDWQVSKVMLHRTIAVCVVVLTTLMLASCPGGNSESESTRAEPAEVQKQGPNYPIPLAKRPYQEVHSSVKEAWFLVETAYSVVKDKYTQANQLIESGSEADKQRGLQMKNEVTQEINRSIFNVNPKVDQLFKDAIEAEPDNPLNYASYAYYLKARRIVDDQGNYIGEGEDDARVNIDKAIELWPDYSGLYLLKIHILSAPHQCHEWYRGSAGENIVLASRLEELRSLFQLAERYDPENGYINYYHALLITDLSPPDTFDDIYDEVLREVIAGNGKKERWFYFPPPLEPRTVTAIPIILNGTEREAIYYDQWSFFGVIAESSVQKMLGLLLPKMQWPQDKENVKHLMLVLYEMGEVRPPCRSFFALQSDIIANLQMRVEAGSDEALELAEVSRFLTQQYFDLAGEMHRLGVILDPRKLDVVGIRQAEVKLFRREPEIVKFQRREASYLHRTGEILGMDFGLPSDPEQW